MQGWDAANLDWPYDMNIFNSELFRCEIIFQVICILCSQYETFILHVAIYQVNKLPVFENRIHVLNMELKLDPNGVFTYTEHMVIEQRYIIVNIISSHNMDVHVKVTINPTYPLAIPYLHDPKLYTIK